MVGCSTGAWSPSEVINPTSSFRQRGMLVALPPSTLYFWDGEPVWGGFFWDGEGCRLLGWCGHADVAAGCSPRFILVQIQRFQALPEGDPTRQITPGPGLKHRAVGKPCFPSLRGGCRDVPTLQWQGLVSQGIAGPPWQQDELPGLQQSVVHPNKMWARWEGECPHGVWGHQLLGTVSDVSSGCFVSLR